MCSLGALGRLIDAQFSTMPPNAVRDFVVVSSKNTKEQGDGHNMYMRLLAKQDPVGPYFAILFYDPNDTAFRLRLTLDDPAHLRDVGLDALLSPERLDLSFRQSGIWEITVFALPYSRTVALIDNDPSCYLIGCDKLHQTLREALRNNEPDVVVSSIAQLGEALDRGRELNDRLTARSLHWTGSYAAHFFQSGNPPLHAAAIRAYVVGILRLVPHKLSSLDALSQIEPILEAMELRSDVAVEAFDGFLDEVFKTPNSVISAQAKQEIAASACDLLSIRDMCKDESVRFIACYTRAVVASPMLSSDDKKRLLQQVWVSGPRLRQAMQIAAMFNGISAGAPTDQDRQSFFDLVLDCFAPLAEDVQYQIRIKATGEPNEFQRLFALALPPRPSDRKGAPGETKLAHPRLGPSRPATTTT